MFFMKISVTLLAVLFYSCSANAQQKNIFKNKPWEDLKKKQELDQKLKSLNPQYKSVDLAGLPADGPVDNSVLKIPLTSTYTGKAGHGTDLYKINGYNMPCIAPDSSFASNMPVLGSELSKNYISPLQKKSDNKN